MLQKFLLTLVAMLLATQLFADINLNTIAMADPILVVKSDNSKIAKSILFDKIEGYITNQARQEDTLARVLMTYEALLPPEAKTNNQAVIALAGDFDSVGDLTQREKYLKGKLVGAVEYSVSVRQIFDMIGLIPTIAPEINQMVTITPITVEGYAGYDIKDKIGYKIVSDILISNDGKTILFGAPEILKKQLTTPTQFPPEVLNAFKANEDQAGTLVFVLPEGLKKDLKENLLDESSLDAAIKDALAGGVALTASWTSNRAATTLNIMAALADEETATLLNTQLIAPWLLPQARQMLPLIIGDSYAFPNTFRSVQKGDHVGFAVDFNENDSNNLIQLIKDYIASTKGDDTEVVIDMDEEEDTSAEQKAEDAPAPAEPEE